MDERMQQTQAVRSLALELGFDLVGFAAAEPFDRWEFYSRWLAEGYAGAMGYLVERREQRRSPSELLPGCRSVVCVAQNYHSGAAAAPGRLEGWISRYAWGDDYHTAMKRRLHQLLDGVRSIGGPGTEGRAFVDTGPILEREAAMRSGLGFIGKNTCLISPKQGSWLFLGEVLTSLQLEPDPPAAPHCGRCTRCLDACPTRAFVGPYLLDATRCISYLTIELRGPIPRELREPMGTHVFGCDICQEVCPWNRFARPAAGGEYLPRDGLRAPELIRLMELDLEAYRRVFKNSPVKRTKYAGLRRNVAVALGNTGAPEAVPVLARALDDPEPLVRRHVAWALGRLGGSRSRSALLGRLAVEADPDVRGEIEDALNDGAAPSRDGEAASQKAGSPARPGQAGNGS
jgi:epoxyqueuosine reductase